MAAFDRPARRVSVSNDDGGALMDSLTPEPSPPREPIGMSGLEDLRVLLELDPGTERVTLRGKQLTDVSTELEFLSAHFPQLRHLDLSDNALASLPSDVGRKLPRLVALDLSNNSVAFPSPEALARSLSACARLKSLSVPLAGGVEDEQRLLELLPGLRILNGVPLCQSGALEAEASSRTVGHSPPSSPQAKRDLRLRFQAIKHKHLLAEEASPSSTNGTSTIVRQQRVASTAKGNSNSVRPREIPASISDDRTDWRKLLKGKTLGTVTASSSKRNGSFLIEATSQVPLMPPPPPPSHVPSHSKAPSRRQRAEQHLLSTEAFLEELKSVVRAFHVCEAGKGDGRKAQETLAMFEQLDKHVERLAEQLGAQERDVLARAPEDSSQQDARASVLRTRWSLLELCGAFGAEKATQVDRNLGSALSRLLRLQKEVLAALHDVKKSTLTSSSRPQGDGGAAVTAPVITKRTKQSSEATQQQLKVLLDVAESLESDLEGMQLQFQQEKARRELLEQENTALKRQLQSTLTLAVGNGSSNENVGLIEVNLGGSNKSPASQRVAKASKAPPRRLKQRKSLKDDANEQVRAVQPTASEVSRQLALEGDVDVQEVIKPPIPAAQASLSVLSSAQTAVEVRSLTLKQLLDLLRSILQSKSRSDARGPASGAPHETLEQHMYTYLNTRFGLSKLIVDYASAIWKASEQLAARDNEVAVFLALLRNHLDEGFLAIKRKLQRALADLLRAYLQSKHPLKPESALTALVKARLVGVIFEDEWTELLTYLYEPQDSAALLRLVKKRSEAFQASVSHQQQKRQRHKVVTSRRKSLAAIPYALLEHVLLTYQLQGRLKLLEPFRAEFDKLDADHDAFTTLVGRVAPSKTDADIQQLVETLDPCHHDVVTFSDAVAALLPAIRGGSKQRK